MVFFLTVCALLDHNVILIAVKLSDKTPPNVPGRESNRGTYLTSGQLSNHLATSYPEYNFLALFYKHIESTFQG